MSSATTLRVAQRVAVSRGAIAAIEPDIGDDLLSTLCTAVIDGKQMTDLEIKAFVSLLLVAGGETTDKAMANIWP